MQQRSRRGCLRREAITAGRRRRQPAALALIVPNGTVALEHGRGWQGRRRFGGTRGIAQFRVRRSLPRSWLTRSSEARSAYARPRFCRPSRGPHFRRQARLLVRQPPRSHSPAGRRTGGLALRRQTSGPARSVPDDRNATDGRAAVDSPARVLSRESTRTTPAAGTEVAAAGRTIPRARALRRKAGVRISAVPSSLALALSPRGIVTSAATGRALCHVRHEVARYERTTGLEIDDMS
jgi:hypothetical protein